jgi:hypothetical protein
MQINEKLIIAQQFESCFDDFKNINVRIEAHEQSKDHFNLIKIMVDLQTYKN